jgi:hypothetical protein
MLVVFSFRPGLHPRRRSRDRIADARRLAADRDQ